jgi:cytochrome c biogenesis protein ResB
VKKAFKFLASLRLAVFIIVCIGVLSAVGTIVEAKYDMYVAQKLVYHSPYMMAVMTLLIINLTAVMWDRWPWKRRHSAFVLAHIGIIALLFGAVVTQKFGIDGQMVVGVGEKSQFVTLPADTQLTVWSSFNGDQFTKLFSEKVDFITRPPSEKDPFVVSLGKEELRVIDYYMFSLRDEKMARSEDKSKGPAIRVQLQNSRVNIAEWLRRPSRQKEMGLELGPARLVLSDGSYSSEKGNEIVFTPAKDQNRLRYQVYLERFRGGPKRGLVKSGWVEPGQSFETGWMDLKARLLNFYPNSEMKVNYIEQATKTDLTTPAVLVDFRGRQQWIGLNAMARYFTSQGYYGVVFQNERIKLDFSVELKKFNIGRYQGTRRAASYSSLVSVPDEGETLISMNEPLKYNGFTFYQASFVEDEMGKPTASVLSVNYDPGRWIKYLGSLLIVLGSILLFYFRRAKWLMAPGGSKK